MKKAFLILCLFLSACSDNSGGVIVADDTPAIPVIPGPFGGPISGDEAINPPSPFIQPYTSQEFQALIDATPASGTLLVDRNALLKNPVFIDKAITIKNDPSKKISIKMQESGQFLIYSSGVNFNNLTFNLENNQQPFQGQIDSFFLPLTSDFTLEKNEFYLRNSTYYLQLSFNGLKVRNNSFIGLCDYCQDLFVLNIFSANGGELVGNTIIDTNDKYSTALLVQDTSNFLVKANVVRAFGKQTFGSITCLGCSNVSLESNILHDANGGRLNAPNGQPNQYLDGSIAIAIANSNGVKDNGKTNIYSAERFILSDDLVGGSTNVVIGAGTVRPAYGNNDLFNYFPTLDLHPICTATDPSISSNLVSGWLNYNTSGGLVYYAGAILPSCY
jgi:hypothetical protein